MLKVREFFKILKNILLIIAYVAGFAFGIYEAIKHLFLK